MYNVDAGDLFGHRVFHLHTRIDFDKIKFTRINVHQELDCACAFIIHMGTDFATEFTNLLALGYTQVGCWRTLHHFLIAPLHGAVTLEQVIDIALFITEDLHFDVPRPQDHFFQIAFAVAKGCFGFTSAFLYFFDKIIRPIDGPHATPATAPRGFEHEGKANRRRLLLDKIKIIAQYISCRDYGYASCHGNAPCTGLVAKRTHGFGPGADKHNSCRITGFDKFRIFGQQPVAGMNRICARHFRNTDNF